MTRQPIHRQFILSPISRQSQVRAWIGRRLAKASLAPFLSGYELHVGLGPWFDPVVFEQGAVVCWCSEPMPHITKGRDKLDLSEAAHGLRRLEGRYP